jgi:hypothetical protein
VLDYDGGAFIELDLGFTPSPDGGGMSFLQQEEVHDAFLLLHGYTPGLDAPGRKEATALVTIIGLSQSVFGYPNEEAFWFDPRAEELGHGFYELQGSRWRENINDYNRRTYGSRPGNTDWHLGGKYENARHFFIGSKDVSAQVLAQGLRIESFHGPPLHRTAGCCAAALGPLVQVANRGTATGGTRRVDAVVPRGSQLAEARQNASASD